MCQGVGGEIRVDDVHRILWLGPEKNSDVPTASLYPTHLTDDTRDHQVLTGSDCATKRLNPIAIANLGTY